MSTQIHTETLETVKSAHALFILDHSGHAPPLTWDAVEEATAIIVIAKARALFETHLAAGGAAYTTTKDGGSAQATKTFDPLAERTILTPRLVGG